MAVFIKQIVSFFTSVALVVTNFTADASNPNQLVISWDNAADVACMLFYSVDGQAEQQVEYSNNTAVIDTVIPGAKYRISLKTDSGAAVIGGNLVYNVPAAQAFVGYSVSKDYMEFMMCRTPSYSGWDRWDLSSSDYTTEFDVGENASFLVRLLHEYDISSDEIVTLYVIRDSDRKIVSTARQADTWSSLWYRNYGEFDIPALPQTAGQYTIDVYFNGALAGSQSFTMY